jgi:hypothetical protein
MANMRDNSQLDDFHEETPREFAAQPDRDFSKLRSPDTPDENQSGSQSSAQSSGSQQQNNRPKKAGDAQ